MCGILHINAVDNSFNQILAQFAYIYIFCLKYFNVYYKIIYFNASEYISFFISLYKIIIKTKINLPQA